MPTKKRRADRRVAKIEVRVTDDEKDEIERAALGDMMPASSWLRRLGIERSRARDAAAQTSRA